MEVDLLGGALGEAAPQGGGPPGQNNPAALAAAAAALDEHAQRKAFPLMAPKAPRMAGALDSSLLTSSSAAHAFWSRRNSGW